MSFRIGVVGCGSIATHYHGPAYVRYAATHDDVELAACCDLDEARARGFAARFGFGRPYSDLDAMLDHERPDAVCLLVKEHHTCEVACRILEKGYPLLTEKPPGRTVEEVDRMIAAANSTGVPTQVAFNRRFAPLARELRHLLDTRPEPGDVQHVRYEVVRVGRKDADFSLTAIHGIDAARFLAGSDYAAVRFHYQALPEHGPTVANLYMDCQFSSGATASLSFVPCAGVDVERGVVHAGDSTFFLDVPLWGAADGTGRLRHYRAGSLAYDVGGADLADGQTDYELMGFYAENASFFDDLRAGRRPTADLRSARQSVAVAEQMRLRRAEYVA